MTPLPACLPGREIQNMHVVQKELVFPQIVPCTLGVQDAETLLLPARSLLSTLLPSEGWPSDCLTPKDHIKDEHGPTVHTNDDKTKRINRQSVPGASGSQKRELTVRLASRDGIEAQSLK